MMPEQLAKTDPFKALLEPIGSGSFGFPIDEYVIGSYNVLVPFDRYVPRQEQPSFMSGGHNMRLDPMDWKMFPDAATGRTH
jgi:peptide/nickel transport system substrate-binding protein